MNQIKTNIMTNIKPITPAEVSGEKLKTIPDVIIETINELIARNFVGKHATIKQEDIINLVKSKDEQLTDRIIFDNHYLDIEEIYEKAGWKVEYDKPAYNETYPATFTFTKKRG